MPQMMPMEWMILYSLFLMSFLMFNIMNYYTVTMTKGSHIKKSINQARLNWKW
nr:ATP synthase F0 subunit 8 [Rhinotermes marginalis]